MACRIMVGYAYYAVEHISPYAMLGSVHVLEGLSVMFADRLADVLKSSLGLSEDLGFSYLRTHGSLDLKHVVFLRTLVDGFGEADAQRIIIENSKIFYRLMAESFTILAPARNSEMPHSPKRVLITGAGSEIGRALAI